MKAFAVLKFNSMPQTFKISLKLWLKRQQCVDDVMFIYSVQVLFIKSMEGYILIDAAAMVLVYKPLMSWLQ